MTHDASVYGTDNHPAVVFVDANDEIRHEPGSRVTIPLSKVRVVRYSERAHDFRTQGTIGHVGSTLATKSTAENHYTMVHFCSSTNNYLLRASVSVVV